MKNKYVKYVLLILIITGLVLPSGLTYAASVPGISIRTGRTSVQTGEEVVFSVNISDVRDLYAFEVKVEYDAGFFAHVGTGTGIQGYPAGPVIKENVITYAFTRMGKNNGVSGDMELCRITLRAINTGIPKVTIKSIKLLDEDLNEIMFNTLNTESSLTVTQVVMETPDVDEQEQEKIIHEIVTKNPDGSATIEYEGITSEGSRRAFAEISDDGFNEAEILSVEENGVRNIFVNILTEEDIDDFEVSIPGELVSKESADTRYHIKTNTAEVVVPSNMFKGDEIDPRQRIRLVIESADTGGLDAETREAIGNRPVVGLSLFQGEDRISWNNPGTYVTVYIDYDPDENELENPEHIVIWYITGDNTIVTITNGRYDPATGKVGFNITHFSRYAVSFVVKAFDDTGKFGWAQKEISVLASRDIIKGTGGNSFSPGNDIIRADFLILIMRTFGLNSEFNGNFNDVFPDKYYYEELGAARQLGIAKGVGNNLFDPEGKILRQDMMVLAARALNLISNDITVLDGFSDVDDVADYAKDAIAALVDKGIIKGDGAGRLNPKAFANRAEAAVIMYRIFNEFIAAQ